MKFTIAMFGGSLAFIVVAYNLVGVGALTSIGFLWFLFCFPFVGYYWIARVVRMAWNHGRPREERRILEQVDERLGSSGHLSIRPGPGSL